MKDTFYTELQKATDEVSQVQPLYRSAILWGLEHNDYYEYAEKDANGNPLRRPLTVKNELVHVGNTDGIIQSAYLETSLSYTDAVYIEFFMLLECKLDQSFRDTKFTAGVLLQVICYLKQMQDRGDVLPKVIVIGSKVNCFAISTNALSPYIAQDINGYKTASTAYKYNSSLIQDIMGNTKIQEELYIYDITPDFDIKDLIREVTSIVQGNNLKLSLDPNSVARAFDYFSMYVLKDGSKIDPRLQQKYFLQLILNADDNDFLPEKDKAYIDGQKVNIDGRAFRAFQSIYKVDEPYTSDEEKRITATADRLIEDADRRRKGDFYTPTVWVDEAHKLLTQHLGADWRDEFVVWDCACGTKNLTRDYHFKELYSSTLIEGDLAISAKYNVPGTPRNELGCAFQYDFLNDDVDEFEALAEIKKINGTITLGDIKAANLKLYAKAPKLLESLCAGKKLLFFINPPYAGTGSMGNASGKSNKTGISNSAVVDKMKVKKISGTNQLYMQFIYRILVFADLFDNISMLTFSPSQILNASSFDTLRNMLHNTMPYVAGEMLCASEFADVSSDWGIAYTLWSSNKAISAKLPTKVDVKCLNANGTMLIQADKVITPVSKDKKALTWANTKVRGIKVEIPRFTSALCYLPDRTYMADTNALATFICDMNIVESNSQRCAIMPSRTNANWSIMDILPDNFLRCIPYFTARRLITGPYATWVNCKDEYMIPDTTHKDYPRFEADSIVYSLFNTASNQSSLRQIDYNGKKWDIKNEFFWCSTQTMLNLARTGKMNKDVEQDILNYGTSERYVYKLLQDINIQANLSPTAKAVLEKATELLIKSFEYRKDFGFNHPEYHINTWDAGWYQIKGILKEYLPDDLKEFNELYKTFSDELRPLVYELGFLYK